MKTYNIELNEKEVFQLEIWVNTDRLATDNVLRNGGYGQEKQEYFIDKIRTLEEIQNKIRNAAGDGPLKDD